jgi:hypothetical protein
VIPNRFLRDQGGPDALAEGFYLIQRRRSNRVALPVRIWFGSPLDEDGVELDRSPRWQIMVAGQLLDTDPVSIGGREIDHLSDFWPACAEEPIIESDYRYRIERAEWAAAYDPYDPFGQPGGKIDPMTATLPFLGG